MDCNILRTRLKQFRHLCLRKPDRFILYKYFKAGGFIFCLIEYYLVFHVAGSIIEYHKCKNTEVTTQITNMLALRIHTALTPRKNV